MTTGEYRVGIDFNPSNDDMVGKIKRAAADLIDLVEEVEVPIAVDEMKGYHAREVSRLKARAMTDIENAAMWAVKAATKPEPHA